MFILVADGASFFSAWGYKSGGIFTAYSLDGLNWIRKKGNIFYVTGHVKQGIASRFNGKIQIIESIKNWQGTGKTFEYYRRELDPENIYGNT